MNIKKARGLTDEYIWDWDDPRRRLEDLHQHHIPTSHRKKKHLLLLIYNKIEIEIDHANECDAHRLFLTELPASMSTMSLFSLIYISTVSTLPQQSPSLQCVQQAPQSVEGIRTVSRFCHSLVRSDPPLNSPCDLHRQTILLPYLLPTATRSCRYRLRRPACPK